jgi:hypothetical protein
MNGDRTSTSPADVSLEKLPLISMMKITLLPGLVSSTTLDLDARLLIESSLMSITSESNAPHPRKTALTDAVMALSAQETAAVSAAKLAKVETAASMVNVELTAALVANKKLPLQNSVFSMETILKIT